MKHIDLELVTSIHLSSIIGSVASSGPLLVYDLHNAAILEILTYCVSLDRYIRVPLDRSNASAFLGETHCYPILTVEIGGIPMTK